MISVAKHITFPQIKLQSHSYHKMIFMDHHKLVPKFIITKFCDHSPKAVNKKNN